MKLQPDQRYGSWTGADIGTFLAEARIPLRVSLTSAHGPLVVPLWFEYRDDRLWSCSPDDSTLVNALRAAPEVGFDVSTNDLPYKGVRGRGRATCVATSDTEALETLLTRYLGSTDNPLSQTLLSRTAPEATVVIDPTWLTSWDFSQRMDGIRPIANRSPEASL